MNIRKSIHKLPKWQMIALPVALSCLLIFFLGKHFIADELIDANDHITSLQLDLDEANRQLEEETARAAVLEREADVLRRANTLLRESERERQDEIAGLKADLAFYRRLGGASGSQAALAVHYLELQPTQSARVYRLIATLTQNLRWAAVISGQVQLRLDGIQDGAALHLTEKQLLPESSEPVSFQFKYFQQIERLITLPENFAPSRLTIRLRSRSLKAPIEESMDWQNLFNRSGSGLPLDEPGAATPDY